jgi:hypothetical protein
MDTDIPISVLVAVVSERLRLFDPIDLTKGERSFIN